MLIKSLEKMESIVFSNPKLFWDGWDVIARYPNVTAWRYRDGVFFKNRWHTQKRYPLTSAGWHLPERVVSRNE